MVGRCCNAVNVARALRVAGAQHTCSVLRDRPRWRRRPPARTHNRRAVRPSGASWGSRHTPCRRLYRRASLHHNSACHECVARQRRRYMGRGVKRSARQGWITHVIGRGLCSGVIWVMVARRGRVRHTARATPRRWCERALWARCCWPLDTHNVAARLPCHSHPPCARHADSPAIGTRVCVDARRRIVEHATLHTSRRQLDTRGTTPQPFGHRLHTSCFSCGSTRGPRPNHDAARPARMHTQPQQQGAIGVWGLARGCVSRGAAAIDPQHPRHAARHRS